jgi:hypothetical protein
MIKCDNCATDAEYISDPPFASTAYFCGSCVPWSLINDQRAGLLPRVEQPAVAVEAPVVEVPKEEEKPIGLKVLGKIELDKKNNSLGFIIKFLTLQ